MPSHYGGSSGMMKKDKAKPKATQAKAKKEIKMPKPMMKPRKELSKGQKELMKNIKSSHTPKHLSEMRRLMKMGYCFQQAHDLATKLVGE